MTPKQLDNVIVLLQIVIPVWLVLRSDWRGVFFGAAVQWGLGILAGELLARTVAERDFNLDALWVFVGWQPCLVFCAVLYGINRVAVACWRTRVHHRRRG